MRGSQEADLWPGRSWHVGRKKPPESLLVVSLEENRDD
jgi:hypothetical protein